MKQNRLDYQGQNVRIYNDVESCSMLIVGDFGELIQVNYDDNLFDVSDLYFDVIRLILSYYNYDDQDESFIKEKINYEKHLIKQGIKHDEIERMREDFEERIENYKKTFGTKTKKELEQAYIGAFSYWEHCDYSQDTMSKMEDAQNDLLDYIRKGGHER